MQFKIPCETYVRLSAATKAPAVAPSPLYLQCVRIEHVNGTAVAMAGNNKIQVFQHLGKTDQPDGAVNIIVSDPALLAQCALEAQWDSELLLDVIDIPGLQIASAKTTYGYTYTQNAGLFGDFPEYNGWRDYLIPREKPKKPKGFMVLYLEEMRQLCECSPSKRIVFPDRIDTDIPVIVRDSVDEDWFAMFKAIAWDIENLRLDAAELPDWI